MSSVTPHTPYETATGDGTTTVVAYSFPVLSSGDLVVTIDGVVTTAYTLTGVGSSVGGTITFSTAPANGAKIVKYRSTALRRDTEYQYQGDFRADVVNPDFNRLWYVIMEIMNGTRAPGASVRAPIGETLTEMPAVASRALKLLSFDSAGNPTAVAASAGTATALSLDLADGTSALKGSALVAFDPDNAYAEGTVGAELRREVWGERYGMSPSNTAADNATAMLAAIAALRGPAVTLSTDGLGSGSLTVYPSGVLRLGPGHFKIAPDTIALTQDVGLVIKGSGSRRMTNYVRGRTVLLVSGTSSGFGIQCKGNGARGLVLEDLDLSYETSAFTGDLLDCYSTPGVTLNRATICSYGITAGTRLQTARSSVRLTYDEFFAARDCALDGAIDGLWLDDTREPSASFTTFGGSQLLLDTVVIYDVTGDMIRKDGTRTRNGVVLKNVTFNPISLDCTRSIDLNNVEGLVMEGCAFSPSVANKASAEWMRLVNCTGSIRGNAFDDLSPAGTVDGKMDISNNRFASTAGLTLMGGVITGSGNEFSAGTYGWRVTTPTYQLALKLGPDEFKAAVGTSYSLGASQTSVTGSVAYAPDYDASTSKWSCSNPRIRIEADDKMTVSQNADLTTTRLLSGRTIELTKTGSSQLVNLHIPTAGEVLRFFKTTNQSAVISAAATTFYYTGGTAATQTLTFASSVVGGYVELEAYGAAGWKVTRASTGAVFS